MRSLIVTVMLSSRDTSGCAKADTQQRSSFVRHRLDPIGRVFQVIDQPFVRGNGTTPTACDTVEQFAVIDYDRCQPREASIVGLRPHA